MEACTIVARNYLPYVRVLATSFYEHHPDGNFFAMVIDAAPDELRRLDESFELISPDEIFLTRDFHELAMAYSIMELATAVKPFLLRHLLARSSEAVVYFDPDIQIFRQLTDVAQRATSHGIVLTPHTTSPVPRDGRTPDELFLLRAGVYNLGFIAVGEGADPFLDWWSERLARDCVIAPDHGLFVDQRWVDLVPGYFDHMILRDPGCNVAYWNLGTRTVRRCDDGSYEVDGSPLRFFHFSGYDPRHPDVLSKHQGRAPRVTLRKEPILRELCDGYGRALLESGFLESASHTYAYGTLPDGTSINHQMRRGFRLALKEADLGRRPRPPDPFADPAAYKRWWASEKHALLDPDALDLAYPPEFREVLGAIARRPKLWQQVVRITLGAYRAAKRLRALALARRTPDT